MNNKRKSVIITIFLVIGSLTLNAQDGEASFKKLCSACHSIGKGKLVGPDLKGVHSKRSFEWIANFVRNAQEFGAKDADAKAMITEFGYPMPPLVVADDELKSIISFIESNSPSEAVVAEMAPAIESPKDPALDPANASQDDIIAGLMLFSGEKRFQSGGPACITCHNVQHKELIAGGLLAKDLTKVYERLGSAGINGMLSTPPFPAMAASYKDNPLTEEEIFQLSAFFNNAAINNIYQPQRAYNANILLYGGVGVFLTIILIISLVFIERKRKCVKEDIYKRQIKATSSK